MGLYQEITADINKHFPDDGKGLTGIERTKHGWKLICAEVDAIKERLEKLDGKSNAEQPKGV